MLNVTLTKTSKEYPGEGLKSVDREIPQVQFLRSKRDILLRRFVTLSMNAEMLHASLFVWRDNFEVRWKSCHGWRGFRHTSRMVWRPGGCRKTFADLPVNFCNRKAKGDQGEAEVYFKSCTLNNNTILWVGLLPRDFNMATVESSEYSASFRRVSHA